MPARPNAALTSDAVLLVTVAGTEEVLLVRRGSEPFQGRWAFPGGFVEPDEDLEEGCRRELREETGYDAAGVTLHQVGAYGAPDRDPRGRVVSVAWWGRLPDAASAGDLPVVAGGDDAADAHWVAVEEVLAGDALAFDHAAILADACVADRRAARG